MKAIYKYPVSPAFSSIELPRYSKILCIQMQGNQPCLWAMVDKDCKEKESRIFEIYGTGHDMKEVPQEYIGTFQVNGGQFVFHVFETFKAVT
jgi:hypothetical protein